MPADDLRYLIQAAVRKHVQPHTGVLLSGGIDSSTIATFAPELPVFTGWYEGEQYDERRYARLIGYSRERYYEFQITPFDFIRYFDEMLASVEPPVAGPGMFGQWMVAKHVAELGIRTVLSGEGGDELFGGYARLMIVARHECPEGYENYVLPADYPRDLEAALAYDYERLPELLRADAQVNAAHGLEAVAPMLDPVVVDYALSLPPRRRVGKYELRGAMRGLLPDAILDRRDKRGFPVPYVQWAQGPLRDFIGDRIGYVPDAGRPWDRGWWEDLCYGVLAPAA